MAEPDKTVKFISKLVQLTQDRTIEWESKSPPSNASETAFVATVEGRSLRIYRYSETIPNPDYALYTSLGISISTVLYPNRPPPPQTIIRSGTVLEVLDEFGRVVYRFDDRTGLSDLYESASYSAAKVDELMDSVLGKK